MTREFEYHPERTVPGRRGPSVVARFVTETGFAKLISARRILDYGCGKGIDIPYYQNLGFDAVGYDPYPPFGFSEKPYGKFDIVVNAFVLNVLADADDRVSVLAKSSKYLSKSGVMVLLTRSKSEVQKVAEAGYWKKHKDGFWSSESRGMFQKGISKSEIVEIANAAGLKIHSLDSVVRFPSSTTSVILCR